MTTPDDPFAPPPGDQPGPPVGGPPTGGPPPWGPPPGDQPPSGPSPGYGSPPGYPPPPGYGSPTGPPTDYSGPPGYGPPPGWGQQPWQPAPATSSKAVVALVLAIASFPVCPLILAIIALVIASQAKQEIAYSGGRVGGEGLVTAARVLAWINIGLCVAFLAFFVLVIAIGVGSSNGTITVTPG